MQKQAADAVEEGAAAAAGAAMGVPGIDGWLRSHLPRLVWAAIGQRWWYVGSALLAFVVLFAGLVLFPTGIFSSTVYRAGLASPLPEACIGQERAALETSLQNVVTALDSFTDTSTTWHGAPVTRSFHQEIRGFDVLSVGVVSPRTAAGRIRLAFAVRFGDRPVITLDAAPPSAIPPGALQRVVGPCVSILALQGESRDPTTLTPVSWRFWAVVWGAAVSVYLLGVLARFTKAAYLDTMTRDLVRGLGLRVVGHVPYERRLRAAWGKVGKSWYVDFLVREGQSRYWSSAERIFARLGLSDRSAERPVVFVTGTRPMLGKSTLARALAFWGSSIGLRTVLVDADMRRGIQHILLRRHTEIGLSNYIAHMSPVDGVIQGPSPAAEGQNDRIGFVARGLIPPNPTQLALRPEVPELLAELQKRFDLVVVDLPPSFIADTKPIIASGGLVVALMPTAVPTWGRDDYLAELESLTEVNQPIVVVTSSAWGVHWSDGLGTSGFHTGYYNAYYQQYRRAKEKKEAELAGGATPASPSA